LACGCSPFYVIRAAYEQSRILVNREDISERIASEETTAEEKEKLALVLEARQFGIDIGLTPKEAFTQYSRVKGEAVAWVVSASPKDEFKLYTWWFPFVGSIPYKGFFDKVDAIEEAKELQSEGYETWVRGTEAFSTLGWFNDPLLSTTLRNPPEHIVNTVLHESLHSTIWVPNHVAFNECLANFVGFEAGRQFYERRLATCNSVTAEPDRTNCLTNASASLEKARRSMERELAISAGIERAYAALKELYESSASKDQKLARREVLFREHIAPLREKYPELQILKAVNNAEIMQLQLYLAHLELFKEHFAQIGGSWERFLSDMNQVKEQYAADNKQDPYALLSKLVQKGASA
jgi:predicted aminopeptidase